jgi:hypothetical protein
LPAQAIECKLAYIDLASEESDFAKDAIDALVSSVRNTQLAANIVGKAHGGITPVMLYAKTNHEIHSVNENLIEKGLASVNRSIAKKFELEKRQLLKNNAGLYLRGVHSEPKTDLEQLIDKQDEAKRKRIHIWQYGDFTQDEDF